MLVFAGIYISDHIHQAPPPYLHWDKIQIEELEQSERNERKEELKSLKAKLRCLCRRNLAPRWFWSLKNKRVHFNNDDVVFEKLARQAYLSFCNPTKLLLNVKDKVSYKILINNLRLSENEFKIIFNHFRSPVEFVVKLDAMVWIWVCCDRCNIWFHQTCCKISVSVFKSLDNQDRFCSSCV